MATELELELENKLIEQLVSQKYEKIILKDEDGLLANLKSQLEKFNDVVLSSDEFRSVCLDLNTGGVFKRAEILRDKILLKRDDGTSCHISLLNSDNWEKNIFQVTHQVTVKGKVENRYDVTILINGLPLVQIELKKPGVEIKKAFNQIVEYWEDSYKASKSGLFQYIQIFVISNDVNTKYFSNNGELSFEQTFFWTDSDNNRVSQLKDFAEIFLCRSHLIKMLTKYTVLNQAKKSLMVFRPYQYYAAEKIVDRVRSDSKNGYIWHTTGSGKTLTSFKVSQLLSKIPSVNKVVFVVDRKDLDEQTIKEFNSFSPDSVDHTNSTSNLVSRLANSKIKLVVTTLQKLNSAISSSFYHSALETVKNKKMVFMFDECHRSQFGETHKSIKEFFGDVQMFGFTGTPIFADNATKNDKGKRTTKDLFDECLHKYVITDAIRDDNVLRFSVEYVGRYNFKEQSRNNIDIDVEGIDTSELLNSKCRLEKIVDYIISNHDRKTHSRTFNSIFAVSSIKALINYYELFKQKKDEGVHDLRIATVFSYGTNEDPELNAHGEIVVESDGSVEEETTRTRDKLEEFIQDYNRMYNTSYTTYDSKTYENYPKDIAKRVKDREIDVLLVVDMFLTGFDSKALNTLYVDKNLRQHGLVQAFSRTNRIFNQKKSHGNIVSFRNLKSATDEAVALFSNKEALENVFLRPLDEQVSDFNDAHKRLRAIAPDVNSVDRLQDESQDVEFIQAFRRLLRLKNTMVSYSDFTFDKLDIEEQNFNNYQSKYLDLYRKYKRRSGGEKVSVVADVDFELELMHRDNIDVSYILNLLQSRTGMSPAQREQVEDRVRTILSGTVELRSKRELIEEFIDISNLLGEQNIQDEFEKFCSAKKEKAFLTICEEEGITPDDLAQLVEEYEDSGKLPMSSNIADRLPTYPSVGERGKIAARIGEKIHSFVEVYGDL